MTKQMIEVEGLPEGWKPLAFRKPVAGEICWSPNMGIYTADFHVHPCWIIEKIKPRRIVLEEIPMIQAKIGDYVRYPGCSTLVPVGSQGHDETCATCTLFCEVKETDISLTNDEPKLSLSVDECNEIATCSPDLSYKILKFIKENS